ncbi:hypothetical protein FRC08_003148 [Ceratobasidium sp. 394]|nr:hypothetical protein FRC08_003148 [Ceratobasidium sp. 394]
MPTLARSAFPAGFPPPKDPNDSPYNTLPWTNAYFCQQLGLAKLGQGFDGGFTEEFQSRLSESAIANFGTEKLDSARHWLREVQRRYREDPKTYVMGMSHIPGSKAFAHAMKVLIDIPGGVRDIIWNTMVLKKATPADALRDVRLNAVEDDLPFNENDPAMIPPSDNYYGHVSVHLARALFGEEAINRSSQSVKEKYTVVLKALFSRTWETKKGVLKTVMEKRGKLPGAYSDALKAAQAKPTAKLLMAANKALSDWRAVADLTGEMDTEEFSRQEELLKQLWESLGRSRNKDGTTQRTKATRQILCSQSELDAAYAHYLELHFRGAGTLDAFLDGQHFGDPESGQLLLADMGPGQGVLDMLELRVAELVHLAGLPPDSVSFPLAEPGTQLIGHEDVGTVSKPAIVPDWHQWVGALAMFRAWFTAELGEPTEPLLLCDEVGLGKTLQMVMTITFLVHLIENQARGLPLPPLLRGASKQHFAGLAQIPSLPILVLVPIAVSSQWRDEILRYTKHGSFQVVLYSRNIQSRQEFFKPNGIWDQVVVNSTAAHRTIIIAEFNTIAKEAEECLKRAPRDKGSMWLADPHPLIEDPGPTIFSMLFLLVVIDEIHALRNVNSLWEGILALTSRCCVRQGATATPVWTGYKDVISALRLLRHPSLTGSQGAALGAKLEQAEKDAGKKWKDPNTVKQFSRLIARKRLEVEGREISEKSVEDSAEIILNVQKKNLRSFFVSYPCISHLKGLLGSAIIRRGLRDLDPDGQPVLRLDPYVESIVYLVLSDVEQEAIRQVALKKPSSVTGKAGELAWVDFLIDYRFVTFHWKLLNRRKLEIQWESWTIEDFREMASSKLKALMMIILYYKKDPNAPPLFFRREDGQTLPHPVAAPASLEGGLQSPASIPSGPETGQAVVVDSTPRKFIVFAMYHIPRQIIKKVFALHDIGFRELDGTMAIKARNKALKEFQDRSEISVLLMSNVGSVGLNITSASIVIVVDQPWSYSELQQILGRAWRKGQKRIVHFYRLIARDTADEMMSGYANGKSLMQDHLLQNDNILDSIHGRDVDNVLDDEAEAIQSEAVATKRSKGKKSTYVKSRPGKQTPATEAETASQSLNSPPRTCNSPNAVVIPPPGPSPAVPAAHSTCQESRPREVSKDEAANSGSPSPQNLKGKGKTPEQLEALSPLAPGGYSSRDIDANATVLPGSSITTAPSIDAVVADTHITGSSTSGHEQLGQVKVLLSSLNLSETDMGSNTLVEPTEAELPGSGSVATPSVPQESPFAPTAGDTDDAEMPDTGDFSLMADEPPKMDHAKQPSVVQARNTWDVPSRSPSPDPWSSLTAYTAPGSSKQAPAVSRILSRAAASSGSKRGQKGTGRQASRALGAQMNRKNGRVGGQ